MSTKSDPRSTSRPAHRAFIAKAKWAHGPSSQTRGRSTSQPRPARPREHMTHPNPRVSGSALKAACADRLDMHDARTEYASVATRLPSVLTGVSPHVSEGESGTEEDDERDEPAPGDGTTTITGASVDRAPSSGSQVLTGALARAIEAFEDRETDRLVRAEWSVLDDDGEEVGFSPPRGKSGKAGRVEGEDEYELV